MEKEKWVIASSCPDWDGCDIYGFIGTEDELKLHLVEMVKDYIKEDGGEVYGVTDTPEYIKNGYAYINFSNTHIDINAQKITELFKEEN